MGFCIVGEGRIAVDVECGACVWCGCVLINDVGRPGARVPVT